MAIEKTFFSYSRTDSAFVMKLAKDLRNAGAELWLDQLDIKAGSRWDSSIESALNAATRVIVVLSPASVGSNNVMDEVSYALENNKTIIPVLLTECTTPFRLRRVQRIDFTGNYQTGLEQLVEILGHSEEPQIQTKEVKQEPVTANTPGKTVVAEQQQQADDHEEESLTHELNIIDDTELPESKIENTASSKKYYFIGGAVVLVLVIYGIIKLNAGDPGATDTNGTDTARSAIQNTADIPKQDSVTLSSIKEDEAIKYNDDNIYTKTEIEAEFPGGPSAWLRFVQNNLKAEVPTDNGASEGTYTVILKFIVSKDGSISGIVPETNMGFGMEQEAASMMKKSPHWIPAKQDGRNVNAYRRQPVTFVVL